MDAIGESTSAMPPNFPSPNNEIRVSLPSWSNSYRYKNGVGPEVVWIEQRRFGSYSTTLKVFSTSPCGSSRDIQYSVPTPTGPSDVFVTLRTAEFHRDAFSQRTKKEKTS